MFFYTAHYVHVCSYVHILVFSIEHMVFFTYVESKKSSVKSALSKASSTPNPQKCREVGKVALKPSLANMGSITRMKLTSKTNSAGRNTVKAVSSGKKSRIPRRVEYMKMKLQLSSSYSDPEPLERKGTLQTLSTQPGPPADPSTGKHHNTDEPGSKLDEIESSVSSLHFLSQLELKKNMSPPNLPKVFTYYINFVHTKSMYIHTPVCIYTYILHHIG